MEAETAAATAGEESSMKLARILRHAVHPKGKARQALTPKDLSEIAGAVSLAKCHREGEIRVVVENTLSHKRLARGTSPAKRSMEIFAKHYVWDTESNDGILIHILLADRHVAVIGDRGINRKVAPDTWKEAVKVMERGFRNADFRGGIMDGIAFLIERLPKREAPKGPPYDLSAAPIVL
jgi:uncharacterized membrane protein